MNPWDRLSGVQVRTLLDAYQRPHNEVVTEQPVTLHKLRALGLVNKTALSPAGQDLVWGWFNPGLTEVPFPAEPHVIL